MPLKMKRPILIAILLFGVKLYSQNDLIVSKYQWDSKPDFSITWDKEDPIVSLQEKYIVEFAYSADNVFEEYNLEHKAIWLNSNDRIEDFNKIYLPYSSTSELLKSKARVITKEGKIIELDDSKILTAQDEETGKNYKYFAFEGVEKGSVIEYFYVEKRFPSFSGTAFRLQSDYEKKNVGFDLYSPPNLVFDFKSYNGLPQFTKDTLLKTKSHWKIGPIGLKALPREEQAPYDASRAFLVYKLDKNTAKNLNDISSYDKVAQNNYNYLNTQPSKKTEELLQEFIRTSIGGQDTTIESKIRSIDKAIKTDFYLSDGNDESLKDLQQILTKKVGSTSGLMRLYIACLNLLKIEHEIVITSNRERLKFDNDFEAHNFLNEYLIFFPSLKTYLSPSEMDTRYGYPPAWLTDNYGLFIKEVSVGNFKSAIGKIKYIEPLPAEKTIDKMIIDVKFDESDITSNTIRLDRSFSGYYAMPIHPYMHLIKGEDRENIIENLAKSMNDNVVVTDSEIVNQDPSLFGIEPIQFIIDTKTNSLVEKAGKKYLFKVGELIGAQIQMYQDKERTLPLENENTRSYYRTINISIPKGYRIANLDELIIDHGFTENGKNLFSFNSFYQMEDGILKINADEHYEVNIVPPSIFEEYRKVINSAADFNKIVLILEPTEG